MKKHFPIGASLMLVALLGGCIEGVTPYRQSPDTVIATAYDTGRDTGVLQNGGAAIAYDPDGCQGWVMDDGLEGYSGRRFDPVSGLPVCNNLYPPGTVVKDYQSPSPGIPDWVPPVR
ncbi:MAG: hypothetical protein Q8Q26_06430 [Pseudorhodobacter sp.]|nr:hypothetical protein [Pseudorhodobacter sp.]